MHLLSSTDLSKEGIIELFNIADRRILSGINFSLKEHATVALFFGQPSTRTRVSFEVAASQLGALPIYIDARTSQASRGEIISDTAKMLSSYCDFIVARINSQDDLIEMADNSKVPVINALTSLEHPTQALVDCYTIFKKKGDLSKLKIAFMGDIAQNTANSLMITAAKLGASFALVGPKDYKPNTFFFNKAREYSEVEVYDSIEEGLEDADIIYTDTFVSMGIEESEREKRLEMFMPYQVNSKALFCAKPDALAMHCLPAHRGEEITADVIDGKRSIVWEQAKNKLTIEKAILIYISEQQNE
jgi:ornithine carbamoyltransferase